MDSGWVNCYLSQDGSRFELYDRENGNQVEGPSGLPSVLQKALLCRTQQAALRVLKEAKVCGGDLRATFLPGPANAGNGRSIDDMITFVRDRIDLFTLETVEEIDEHLREIGATGGVTSLGKRILHCGEREVDLKQLQGHIARLGREGAQQTALLDELQWYAEDAYREAQEKGVFTRLLFWIRGGHRARPKTFDFPHPEYVPSKATIRRVRDFLYFLRKQKIDAHKPVQISLKNGRSWREENIVSMCLDSAHFTMWHSKTGKVSFRTEDIASIESLPERE